MPDGLVIVDLYRWTEVDEQGIRTTNEAPRGATVTLTDDELERGKRLGALADPTDYNARLAEVNDLEAQASNLEAEARAARARADAARAALPDLVSTVVGPGEGPTPQAPSDPNALTTPAGVLVEDVVPPTTDGAGEPTPPADVAPDGTLVPPGMQGQSPIGEPAENWATPTPETAPPGSETPPTEPTPDVAA